VKVTLTVQLDPGVTGGLQLFVWAKSPLAEIFEKVRGKSPRLVTKAVFGALVIPTNSFPKSIADLERLKTAAKPVPSSETVLGLPMPLLATVRTPLRRPRAVGVNVTEMVQFALTASDPGQLFDWAKSPVVLMTMLVNEAFPVLVSVTAMTPLVVPKACPGNVMYAGESVAAEPLTPTPLSAIAWGEVGELFTTVICPAAAPNPTGEKTTLMAQPAPMARVTPQLFVCEKGPAAVMLEMVTGVLPGLLKVNVCGGLVIPTPSSPNPILGGNSAMTGLSRSTVIVP